MAPAAWEGHMSIGDITLTTPDHETVLLGDRIGVPTVVILARYYG